MNNAEKDVEMRRLANKAVTVQNEGDGHLACIIASAIVDIYVSDDDFTESGLDVADTMLRILEAHGEFQKALGIIKRKREVLNLPPLEIGSGQLPDTQDSSPFRGIIAPTRFDTNSYHDSWYDQDFFVHIDGIDTYSDHACKMTWLASKPLIRSFRTAVDIGCREGVYSRYLHKHFDHTYSFDARKLEHFSYNVDLSKVTHFTCALGDENTQIQMFGGTHRQVEGQMKTMPCFRLDEFGFKDVDYIKIDVEGFEEKVIKGGLQTIEASWPLIVIEQNEVCLPGDDQYAAKYFLESIGYEHVESGPAGIDLIMQKN